MPPMSVWTSHRDVVVGVVVVVVAGCPPVLLGCGFDLLAVVAVAVFAGAAVFFLAAASLVAAPMVILPSVLSPALVETWSVFAS